MELKKEEMEGFASGDEREGFQREVMEFFPPPFSFPSHNTCAHASPC
jgi:hypothetical protein